MTHLSGKLGGAAVYLEGGYAEHNPAWHVEDSPWKADQILKLINDCALRPSTICEVGTGAGEILVRLQKKLDPQIDFWGYDISPQAIHLCRPKQNGRLHFVEGSPKRQNGEPFDLLLGIDVIEHVEDCFGFLRDLAPLARQHIFHIPLEMHVSAVARISPLLEARRQVGHIHYFSRETALALLADTGYTVVAERFTAGALGLRQRHLRTQLARMPRAILGRLSPGLAARWIGGYSLLVLVRPVGSP